MIPQYQVGIKVNFVLTTILNLFKSSITFVNMQIYKQCFYDVICIALEKKKTNCKVTNCTVKICKIYVNILYTLDIK